MVREVITVFGCIKHRFWQPNIASPRGSSGAGAWLHQQRLLDGADDSRSGTRVSVQYGEIRRLIPGRIVTGKNAHQLEQRADKLEQAAVLDLPILIITGTYDPIFEPRLMRKLHKALPNSTLHEIKDSGHSPYFGRPEIENQLVLDHFAGNR